MNTRQFEYILAVDELKNFGLAADKCYITQSTLSTMIGRFEEEIGIKIFDRSTKPVTITMEGNRVLNQIRNIYNELGNLNDIVDSLKGELSGDITIGVIPTIAPYLLPRFINRFARKYPKLNFIVREMITETIEDQLEKRELDIGILALSLNNKSILELELYREPFVLFDCTGKSGKIIENIDSIDKDNFWLLEDGHCLTTQVTSICDMETKKANKNSNFDFRAGSIDSLIRFVKINKGQTLLPYLSSIDIEINDEVNLCYFDRSVPVRSIGLAVHRNFAKNKLLIELKKEIKNKIKPLLKSEENEVVYSPKNS